MRILCVQSLFFCSVELFLFISLFSRDGLATEKKKNVNSHSVISSKDNNIKMRSDPYVYYQMSQCLGQVEELIFKTKNDRAKSLIGPNQWLIQFFINHPGLTLAEKELKLFCHPPHFETPIEITEFLIGSLGSGLKQQTPTGIKDLETTAEKQFFEILDLWEQYQIYLSKGLTATCFKELFKDYESFQNLLSYARGDPQFYASSKKLLPDLIKKMSEARKNGQLRKVCKPPIPHPVQQSKDDQH